MADLQTRSRRRETLVIHDTKTDRFHFVDPPLSGGDDWFPVNRDLAFAGTTSQLFQSIEVKMIEAGVAHNLTYIEPIRSCGHTVDYRAVYNAPKRS